MFKLKTDFWDKEKLEALRILWMQLAEDKIREKRVQPERDLLKPMWQRVDEYFKITEAPLTKEENAKLKEIDVIINNAVTYGYMLEEKDLC